MKRSLSFLQESRLINQDPPIISLQNADLSQVHLEKVTLGNVSLSDAILRQAHMEEAVLFGYGGSLSLYGADLTEANLKKVVIYGNADLSGSILKSADLRGAELISENHTEEMLQRFEVSAGADTDWARWARAARAATESKRAGLEREVKLVAADLEGADLLSSAQTSKPRILAALYNRG